MRRAGGTAAAGAAPGPDWRERLVGAVLWRCDQYDAASGQFAAVSTRAALAACGAGETGGGGADEGAALGVYFSFGEKPDELAPRLEAAVRALGPRLCVVQVALWSPGAGGGGGSVGERERAHTAALRSRPWFAVPFSDVRTKRRLTRRYGIATGVPALVVRGRHVREELLADPAVRAFPWPGPALGPALAAADLRRCADLAPAVPASAAVPAVRAFYFAAHWCPPCRVFTPAVAAALAAAHTRWAHHADTQLVLVSSDRSEDSFERTVTEVARAEAACGGGGGGGAVCAAWRAEDARRALADALGVRGLPALVLVDPADRVLCRAGRAAVADDPLAWNFPWEPRSWSVLTERTLEQLNRHPAVLLFIEGTAAELEFAGSVLGPAGDAYREERALRGGAGGGGGGAGDTSSSSEGESGEEAPGAGANRPTRARRLLFVACVARSGPAEALRARAGLDDAVPLVAGVDLARGRLQLERYGAPLCPRALQHFTDTFLASQREARLK